MVGPAYWNPEPKSAKRLVETLHRARRSGVRPEPEAGSDLANVALCQQDGDEWILGGQGGL